jgi:hypothetical protein
MEQMIYANPALRKKVNYIGISSTCDMACKNPAYGTHLVIVSTLIILNLKI